MQLILRINIEVRARRDRSWGRAMAAAAATLLAACAGVPELEAAATQQQSIINGTDSVAAQDFTLLIVGLVPTSAGMTEFQCSGALLAPNLVLTARHCVSSTAEGTFACDPQGNLITGSTGGTASDDFAPEDLLIFTGTTRPKFSDPGVVPAAKGKTIIHDSGNVLCSHDLALIVLDRSIPNATLASIRLDSPAVVGETITAIGWGITVTKSSPDTRQQRTGIPVLRLGPSPAPADGSDGAVATSEIEVGESICQGDSGGPAIAETTGAVVGSASAGGNGGHGSRDDPGAGCSGPGTFNFYTAVAPFKSMILGAYQQAGAQPWLEGQPQPMPVVDAGPGMGNPAKGCGCSTSPLSFAALLALCLAARRRVPART